MPLKINAPGTPFEPGHPFATPQILFMPRSLAAHRAAARAQLPPATPQMIKDVDAGYVRFRRQLLNRQQGQQQSESHGEQEIVHGDAVDVCPADSRAQLTEAVIQPLVPQRPPDLEDIAFEILRQRYRKR